ncbi:MAG TPA: hypothetical protein VIF62_34705, partial [Labilithrix sp.]
ASTIIVGSDPTSYYLLDDAQDTFYRFDKQSLALTPVATLEGVVSYPQIAAGYFWYVRDQKRVFQLSLSTDTQATPTEMFGIGYDACDLAVGSSYAYCSTSGVIEQRDLTGGNPKDVLDSAKSKIASPFGAALSVADGLLVRSSSGDPALQDVIRAVAASGDEKLVACGRSTIATMATDGKNVAWVEKTGLFAAQR